MAATWTSTKFSHRAPADGVLIRSFVGGPGREELVRLDDAALIQLVRRVGRDLGHHRHAATGPGLPLGAGQSPIFCGASGTRRRHGAAVGFLPLACFSPVVPTAVLAYPTAFIRGPNR